jgi:hypothetical protein
MMELGFQVNFVFFVGEAQVSPSSDCVYFSLDSKRIHASDIKQLG